MRPFTTQCWTLSSELPMGCCCSNSKIQPESETRRELNRRVIKDSVFAPPTLAIPTPSSNITEEKSVKKYTFGENSLRGRNKKIVPQEESSDEDIEFEFSDDIRNYNKALVQLENKGSTKGKIPKSKGFDFPLFPPIHGEKCQGPASSAVAAAALAARTLIKDKLNDQRKFAQDENANIRYAKSYKFPSTHTYGSTRNTPRTGTSQQPQQRLHYKRIDAMKNNRQSVPSDDEYTAVTSDAEKDKPTQKKKVGVKARKEVVAVKRKNAQTQYYEQTYTRSGLSFGSSSRPNSRTLNDENMNYNAENYKLGRSENLRERPQGSAGFNRKKATEQRILDAYLSQPKVLIVPIIRERRKQDSVNQEQQKLPRRILKKPWRTPSRKNLPMLRESGIGSSNIRFAAGVRVHRFNVNDFQSESGSCSNSSLGVRTPPSTPSLDKPRVRKQLRSRASRDRIHDNFMIQRYIKKANGNKTTGRARTAPSRRPSTSVSPRSSGLSDQRRRVKMDEYYILTSPSRHRSSSRR